MEAQPVNQYGGNCIRPIGIRFQVISKQFLKTNQEFSLSKSCVQELRFGNGGHFCVESSNRLSFPRK